MKDNSPIDDRAVSPHIRSDMIGELHEPREWTSQLLPMDNMPGAMDVKEIPFGMESTIPAIRCAPRVCEGLPKNLDTKAPGIMLAAILASIDIEMLTASDQLIVMRAHQRMISHHHGNLHRDMAVLTETLTTETAMGARDAEDAAEAEISVALRLSRRAAHRQLAFAMTVANRLPRLGDMLESGDIDLPRAMAIDRYTAHLSDIEAQAILDRIAETAPSLTIGQLRARIEKLCIRIDPDQAKKRYDNAADDRTILSFLNPTGTANLLGFDLPPEKVASITDRIDSIARRMRGTGETRTIDQLRADVFVDLLTGRNHQTTRRGAVDIRVDVATLLMLNDDPGDLAGFGPVIADVVRRVVKETRNASFRISIVDGPAGTPIHTPVDTTASSRTPSAAQRRRIEVRDPVCVFPGCRVPSTRSDIDHILAVQDGGRTTDTNLAPLCRHHHRIKHRFCWTYTRESDGAYLWKTMAGQEIDSARDDPP